MSITIPIVIAFDNHYAIPAGVSLYSMLACAKTKILNRKMIVKNFFIKSTAWWIT